MKSEIEVVDELKESKEYREAFVAAHVKNGIAFQLRSMRSARGWDQKELARRMGNEKLQPVVSRYENPDYGKFSVSTLLELAKVFDVALIVKFASFNEIAKRDANLSSEDLTVESFEESPQVPIELVEAWPQTCTQIAFNCSFPLLKAYFAGQTPRVQEITALPLEQFPFILPAHQTPFYVGS
jgi:transcriptional regulator with XRE-family HTH domain